VTALTSRVLALLPNARLHLEDAESGDVIIEGPPGCGKTASLNALLDAHLQAGHEPDRLLVNAFTRNATQELRRRLRERYGAIDMPWVRTIHSSCFHLLGLRTQQVVGPHSLREFGEASGFELKGALGARSLEDPYGGGTVVTVGDWCYVAEELRRQRLWTTEQSVGGLRPPGLAQHWDLDMARDFSLAYATWKKESGLYDFADMLERVLEGRMRPPVRQMFIDEAQDNTPLVWAVIDLWRQEAERLFVHGDSDQCLYQWSGADPKGMSRRSGSVFTLSHSYRLPSVILKQAQQIIRRTRDRIPKDFEPDREGGGVERVWDWVDVALDRPGSWFLLCRNRFFLEDVRTQLIHRGVAFRDRTSLEAGVPPLDSEVGRAVDAVWRLSKGEVLSRARLRHLRRMAEEKTWPRDGIDGPGALVDLERMGAHPDLVRRLRVAPLQALQLAPGRSRYLEAVLRREGALTAPRVELGTIHSVKGEEGAHVAVSTAMTHRTWEEYQLDPDQENRVFYVAATRARESLTWLLSGGKGFIV
jgi:superfamily I DNA/RNA helicase